MVAENLTNIDLYRNANGKFVARDPDTGETYPVPFESVDVEAFESRGVLSSQQDSRYRTVGTHKPMPSDAALMTDLTGWTEQHGTISIDAERSFRGSSSMKLVGDNDNSSRALFTFDSAVDMTDMRPLCRFRIDKPTDAELPIAITYFDTTGDSTAFNYRISSGAETEAEWITHQGGVTSNDNADLTAIDRVRVSTSAPSDVEWNVDDIRFVPALNQGYAIIGFDDSHIETYDNAFPIMQDYGATGYEAVVPNWVESGGGDSRMTVEMHQELHEAGWGMLNHTWSHQRYPEGDASLSEMDDEIRDAKIWLKEHDLHNGQSGFVYPAGNYDDGLLEIVDRYHDIGLGTTLPSSAGVAGVAGTPLHIPRGIGNSVSGVQDLIDTCARNNMIANIYLHDVGVDGDLTESEFESVLDHIENTDNMRAISWNEFVDIVKGAVY